MKKRSIIKSIIIRLFILGIMILIGTGIIAGTQYYNKVIKEKRELARAFTRIATNEIDGDFIEEFIKRSGQIREWWKAPESLNENDLSEEEQDFITRWDRISALFVETVENNPNFRSFRIIVPEENDVLCIWGIGMEGDTLTIEEPMTRRPFRAAEEKASKSVMGSDDGERDYLDELMVSREGDELIETAVFPVWNNDKDFLAFTELDISITDVRTKIIQITLFIAGLIFFILAAGLIIFFFALRKEVILPVLQLEKAASGIVDKLAEGGSAQKLDIHAGNELDSLARSFENMEENLIRYINENNAITAEKERINAELDLAAKIQADMLPAVFPSFSERKEFDLYASMTPAKEVGGDFYDFFMIDQDTLALVIADVSEKGVPAAMFMMRTMLMIESMASQTRSPSAILGSVNNKLCDNNDSGMFVTIWLGILDIRSGMLKAANAGHEYPIIKMPGGKFEIFKDRHSFFVGGKKNAYYKEYELELLPDTTLFLYTDGVPEAKNEEGEMFRLQAAAEALNRVPDGTPEELLEAVNSSVKEFMKDAEPFDDLTMMCLHYNGISGDEASVEYEQEITLKAVEENIDPVREFINNALAAVDCSSKIRNRINVVAEELFGNIAMYAYADSDLPEESRTATIRLKITKNPCSIVITFMDRGIPFDPLAKKDPNFKQDVSKRKEGGLGIYISKKFLDHIHYVYKDGRNTLTIIKQMEES